MNNLSPFCNSLNFEVAENLLSSQLTPWLYGPPNYVFFANDRPSDESTSKMIQHLYEGPGIGTKCMANSPVSGKTCAVPIVESDKNHLVPDFNVSRAASASCSCAVSLSFSNQVYLTQDHDWQ